VGISLSSVKLEITPEPDDAERAAIAAALEAEEKEKEPRGPASWLSDEPHP
jgi:hypothetical protein